MALAWIDTEEVADVPALSRSVQESLEAQGAALLVLVHETPGRVMWYAYAADESVFDRALASLANAQLRWGVNEDPDWLEYEHGRNLVGA